MCPEIMNRLANLDFGLVDDAQTFLLRRLWRWVGLLPPQLIQHCPLSTPRQPFVGHDLDLK